MAAATRRRRQQRVHDVLKMGLHIAVRTVASLGDFSGVCSERFSFDQSRACLSSWLLVTFFSASPRLFSSYSFSFSAPRLLCRPDASGTANRVNAAAFAAFLHFFTLWRWGAHLPSRTRSRCCMRQKRVTLDEKSGKKCPDVEVGVFGTGVMEAAREGKGEERKTVQKSRRDHLAAHER